MSGAGESQATAHAVGGTLLVFAHRDEADAFQDVPHVLTGVGKLNAALGLQRALTERGPARVLVLGTAGAIGDGAARLDLDTPYLVEKALQHDFSLPSPTISLHVPPALAGMPRATIATGDQFVQDDAKRARIASLGAELVDMECYAYARVCEERQVPLTIVKIPSDFADSDTSDAEWDEIVFRKSAQLRSWWDAFEKELQ